MNEMRSLRRAITVLCAGLILACALVCVMWVRSYFRTDGYTRTTSDGGFAFVRSHAGGVQYLYLNTTRATAAAAPTPAGWTSEPTAMAWIWTTRPPLETAQLAGFTSATDGTFDIQVVPYWFLLVALALPPSWWFLSGRHRRPLVRGTCPACGYDLRTNPSRCPECGQMLDVPPPALSRAQAAHDAAAHEPRQPRRAREDTKRDTKRTT